MYRPGYLTDALQAKKTQFQEYRRTFSNEELIKIINMRIEPAHPFVRDAALLMVAKFSVPEDSPGPGGPTINQICSIYSYLKNGDYPPIKGWIYVNDPRGSDYFNYANESVSIGDRSDCTGAGDCDDFAILMASLVESIGGTTRIILAITTAPENMPTQKSTWGI